MKHILCFVFRAYIQLSIHLSIAITALTAITLLQLKLPFDLPLLTAVFSGTLISYNTIKYTHLYTVRRMYSVGIITLVSAIVFFISFEHISLPSQLLLLLCGLICIFYAFPLLGKKLRSIGGIKIVVVAFCWSLVSVIAPVLEYKITVNQDIIVLFFQNLLWVIALILPFDIRDIGSDSIALKTLPQTLGTKRTKQLGSVSILCVFLLCYFRNHPLCHLLIPYGISLLISFILLLFSNEKKSDLYFSFVVESVPILSFILFLIFCYEC